jgi:hypothetical protein
MRIEVLDDAKEDLADGFHFYEEQSPAWIRRRFGKH